MEASDWPETWKQGLAAIEVSPRLVVRPSFVAFTPSPGQAELVGRMILAAQRIAAEEGIAEDGYRLVVNCNRHGCQEVYHLHLHLIGGRQLRGISAG